MSMDYYEQQVASAKVLHDAVAKKLDAVQQSLKNMKDKKAQMEAVNALLDAHQAFYSQLMLTLDETEWQVPPFGSWRRLR